LALTPQEKAAIEAQRRERPALKRWYPEAPEEEKKVEPLLAYLLTDAAEEESAAKTYREKAEAFKKEGMLDVASTLEEIAEEEEKHAELLRKAGSVTKLASAEEMNTLAKEIEKLAPERFIAFVPRMTREEVGLIHDELKEVRKGTKKLEDVLVKYGIR